MWEALWVLQMGIGKLEVWAWGLQMMKEVAVGLTAALEKGHKDHSSYRSLKM